MNPAAYLVLFGLLAGLEVATGAQFLRMLSELVCGLRAAVLWTQESMHVVAQGAGDRWGRCLVEARYRR